MILTKITADSSANKKILFDLRDRGCIELSIVQRETDVKKIKNKIKPTGVYGLVKYGQATHGRTMYYKEILKIIGRNNAGDALNLDTHIKSGNDIFVTEDTDFLNYRTELFKKFSVVIHTPSELKIKYQ